MFQEKPFIKLFQVMNAYYIYDVNSNKIIETNQEIYTYLDAVLKNASPVPELNSQLLHVVQDMLQAGLLQQQADVEIEHVMTDQLENILEHELSRICLQVTQNCNLRCKYCVFSGSYVNRVHNNKRMDWETAKRALDFLYEHSGESDKEVMIGFYGGEPLLEFDLIQKCVEYSYKLFPSKNLQFNITTNATLLHRKVAQYLLDNNFSISISIDGPQAIHDLNRVYVNGQGSFESVMGNLQGMLESIPDVPTEKFIISTVVSNDADLESVVRFFKEDSQVSRFTYQLTSVNDVNMKQRPLPTCKQNEIINEYEKAKIFLYGVGRIPIEMTSRMAEAYANQLADTFCHRTAIDMTRRKLHPGGPCVPGQHKLFVDVEGNLYPCERVSETSPVMKMGSLESGFDIAAAKRLLNVGQATEKECSECWAFHFCTQCVAFADGVTEISKEKRLSECERVKTSVEEMMKDYIVLQTYGCEFEKYENIKF
ncbi:Cys-rich peptide radical SAM maturase CcpM [Paenibacillus sp. CAA11]|uniref:Cys-rich peptide radical SAM maturase CcpM n=1 Tax=Paenibacillus sp. CAA11 TaxID=1532905 RepID=UPI000D3660F0|nr:Cys-rich peptide radical SAM maturase CcpM [Paenibacillus sp. CAA11]AWB45570.1 Cys-rich peptide radical SAM maturase CcpM [Paenibacillus sp. CAA11]